MLLDEEVYQCAEAPVLSKQVDFDDALCHGVRRVCIVWVIREGMLSHFVLKEEIPDWVFKCVYGLSKLESRGLVTLGVWQLCLIRKNGFRDPTVAIRSLGK